MNTTYDVIGIGFGPANIALAIALEESGFQGKQLFLEGRASAEWQPEMLLPGADIQNHPCRDLVTPRNPRSRYTFMNFLFEHNRLFEHLNLGIEFPLRLEYAHYIAWAAQFFADRVRYQSWVSSLTLLPAGNGFRIETADGTEYTARSVVVAPGRTLLIPEIFKPLVGPRVFHLTQLRSHLQQLSTQGTLRRIAVVGGSQSAAEIVLHLRAEFPEMTVHNVMRSYGYRLKDTSQFSEQVYFPEFVDYYYSASPEAKRKLNQHLHATNYSAVDGDVIRELYLRIYEDRLTENKRICLHPLADIALATVDGQHVKITLREVNTGQITALEELDAVVLATGFRNLGAAAHEERTPPLLAELYEHLALDETGCLQISRDYALLPGANKVMAPLYLNGLCESSHGYGDAGSFSLLSLRAAEIERSLQACLSQQGANLPVRHPCSDGQHLASSFTKETQ